jgi:hypothetical protein
LTSLAMSAPAAGQEVMMSGSSKGPNLLEDAFQVSLGTYIVSADTTIRLDATNEDTGTTVDWDRVVGGGDASRFRLDGAWRFGDRHKLRAMWFDFSRSRTETLDREIEWGDEVFPVSAEATAKTRFSIYEVAYEYAFLKRETLELTGTAGIHWTQYKAELSATLNGASGTREASDSAKLNAPLPVVGVRGLWRIHRNFWLDGAVQYFALQYDVYDGSILDTRIGVLWQPSKWVGIGLGYNRFDVDVDLDDNDFQGKFEWVYDGPQLFYNVSF